MSHKPTVDLSNFYLFFWHDDMTILSKVSKADNFDSHKFQQFCWMWIVSWIKFSLFSCFIWDKLGRLIDSSKFAVVGYLPLIRKNSVTYMYGLAVFAGGRNFLFCRDWSLENSWRFLFMYSNGFTSLCVLHLVPYFFLLCWLPSSSLCMFFDDISSNIDEDFSINHLNVFVTGDSNVHHKEWLHFSGGTDRPGELCYRLSISNDLIQMVNFPARISCLWPSQSMSFRFIYSFKL